MFEEGWQMRIQGLRITPFSSWDVGLYHKKHLVLSAFQNYLSRPLPLPPFCFAMVYLWGTSLFLGIQKRTRRTMLTWSIRERDVINKDQVNWNFWALGRTPREQTGWKREEVFSSQILDPGSSSWIDFPTGRHSGTFCSPAIVYLRR